MWFRAFALLTGLFALLMSCVPTLVYMAMAPAVRSEIVFETLIWLGLPILLSYSVAFLVAVRINPGQRQVLAVILLCATVPVSWLLMIHGLR